MTDHHPLSTDSEYQRMLGRITTHYSAGRFRATRAVNAHLLETYWQIGHDIVEFEQGGKIKAEYGTALLDTLSRDLTLCLGKGFSRSNVIRIRQFYVAYPKGATLSHQLSWSHVVELLKIDDPLERGFYEQQAVREKWAVRELKRQKDTGLFLRLAAGKTRMRSCNWPPRVRSSKSPKICFAIPMYSNSSKFPNRMRSRKRIWRHCFATICNRFSWNSARVSRLSAGSTASR